MLAIFLLLINVMNPSFANPIKASKDLFSAYSFYREGATPEACVNGLAAKIIPDMGYTSKSFSSLLIENSGTAFSYLANGKSAEKLFSSQVDLISTYSETNFWSSSSGTQKKYKFFTKVDLLQDVNPENNQLRYFCRVSQSSAPFMDEIERMKYTHYVSTILVLLTGNNKPLQYLDASHFMERRVNGMSTLFGASSTELGKHFFDFYKIEAGEISSRHAALTANAVIRSTEEEKPTGVHPAEHREIDVQSWDIKQKIADQKKQETQKRELSLQLKVLEAAKLRSEKRQVMESKNKQNEGLTTRADKKPISSKYQTLGDPNWDTKSSDNPKLQVLEDTL